MTPTDICRDSQVLLDIASAMGWDEARTVAAAAFLVDTAKAISWAVENIPEDNPPMSLPE